MNNISVNILKSFVYLIGIIILGICLLALPNAILSEIKGDFDYGWIFLGMYITAVPFFLALFEAIRLLTYIEKDKVFTKNATRTLKLIKNYAYLISLLFAAYMPYIFYLGDKDDAPGVVALGFVIIFASFVIGTCAAVFQHLLHRAVLIKSENDLTV